MKRSGKNNAPKKKNGPTRTTTPPKKLSKTGEGGNGKLRPKPFPIVGIGASAGGLEAFSKFLDHLPPDLGMAYIFVQHLSPTHESHLPEILRRKTKMKVHEAKDSMPVEKNNIYVIPPNNSLTITDGKLKLIPEPKGKRSFHPIDLFLSSLASVYKNNAIGIILSGTATDGTLGLKAIKAEGGISFAQDETAKYQGMPRYAAEMGYVDFVMPPEKIAEELASLVKHPLAGVMSASEFMRNNAGDLHTIHTIMNTKKNIDFSHYKQTTIQRRIMRRMLLNKVDRIDQYARLLKENNNETDALHQDLLINVTDFFRDPLTNEALVSKVFPAIVKDRKPNDPIRIWIAGCSSGEEAITIAILLIEYMGEKAISLPIQIFATDLNEKAIEKARLGFYSKSAVENISSERLKRFFIKENGHYRVVKSIRDICVFAAHNLLKDPPFSHIDLISCQNVLIYLEASPQQRIMQTFHYALKNTGFLVVGKSEGVGRASDLFEAVGKNFKVYTKKNLGKPLTLDFTIGRYNSFTYPGDNIEEYKEIKKETDIDKETEKLLLSQYSVPAILINKDLEIIRLLGTVHPFLEPASGKASLHLMKMVKEEIAYELRSVIFKAKKSGVLEKKEGLAMTLSGVATEITIEVMPVKTSNNNRNGTNQHFLVVFKNTGVAEIVPEKKVSKSTSDSAKDKRIKLLEKQLKDARDSVKEITEEFEATREELQSSSEEVLSSNEELQSVNEELETSKEELQSTNEELMTINDELQNRNNELKDTLDYASAILETMHEPLIVLSADLHVKTANKSFYNTFNVTPEETENFYLYELGNNQWDIPELRHKLVTVQSQNIRFANFEVDHVFPGISHRIMKLNAQKFFLKEGRDALILLAIEDITERKQAERILMENEERFRLLIQNAFDIITVFDESGTIKYISPSVESILGYSKEERLGKNILLNKDTHPDDFHLKEKMFTNSLKNPGKNTRAEFRLQHKNGTYRTMDAVCLNLLDDSRVQGIIANYRDITDRKISEQQKDDFIGIASHELKTPVTSIKAYAQILHEKFLEQGDHDSAEMIYKMHGQIDRLTMLIGDLLDFTHIEGDKLKFRNEEYDLNKLILQSVEEIQRLTKEHKLETVLDRTQQMQGDRFRTGEVITNLLSNAIKYSPDANKIIITSKVEDEKVTVSVRDFGIGIDEEQQDNVFDRFYRISDPSINTFPGLGLGLYIAAEIIKKQGGKIWVKSKKGEGSEFAFSLPVKSKIQ